jgi:putative restriction endonuclease
MLKVLPQQTGSNMSNVREVTLTKRELVEVVVGGLRAQGWLVTHLNNTNPFEVALSRDSVTFEVRIYVWNVTHGGGAHRPESEQRIQITGVPRPLGPIQGGLQLLCGVHEATGVLAVFDPKLHIEPSAFSPSLQISESTLNAAGANGFAVYHRTSGEVALAIRPDLLALYLNNQEALHDAASSDETLEKLNLAAMGDEDLATELLPPTGLDNRIRAIVLVARAVRDNSFRRRVMEAYGYTCAICGMQIGMVEAAHIILAAATVGSDATSNGIALCVLHHKAYDLGILGIFPDYSIHIDVDRLEERGNGLGGRAEELTDYDGRVIATPSLPADKPNPDFLSQGLRERGWRL